MTTATKMGYDKRNTVGGKADGIRNVQFTASAGEVDVTDQTCGGVAATRAGLRKYGFTCEVLAGSEAFSVIAAALRAGTVLACTFTSETIPDGNYCVTAMNETRGTDVVVAANCTFAYNN